MSLPIEMTLTFATRYNGVYLTVDDDNFDITEEIEKALEEVSNTLPSMTYDMVEKFDNDLDDDQIEELIERAKEIIKPVLSNVVINFEYDVWSS